MLAARDGIPPAAETEYAFTADSGPFTARTTERVAVDRVDEVEGSAAAEEAGAGAPQALKAGVKNVDFEIRSLGLTVGKSTKTGSPKTDAASLNELAGHVCTCMCMCLTQ